MTCDIHLTAVDAVWPALLQMLSWSRQSDSHDTEQAGSVYLVKEAPSNSMWQFSAETPADLSNEPHGLASLVVIPMAHDVQPLAGIRIEAFSSCSVFQWHLPSATDEQPDIVLKDVGAQPLPRETRSALRLYLPTIVGAYRARQRGEAFVTAHIAQTLDGRIACLNGHSQWISNHDNLIHSHRLRALHDAVLVGSRTLINDNPKLTVRHVEGENPRRVLVSGSGKALITHAHHDLFSDHGVLALVGERASEELKLPAGWQENSDRLELHPLPQNEHGSISPRDITSALHAHDLSSVFIEGGGATISSFMQHGALDLLHIHIAPKILGSGVSSFTLPEISEIHDGETFAVRHFTLNGEILFECRRTSNGSGPK